MLIFRIENETNSTRDLFPSHQNAEVSVYKVCTKCILVRFIMYLGNLLVAMEPWIIFCVTNYSSMACALLNVRDQNSDSLCEHSSFGH